MLKIELEQSGNTLLCRATQRGEELGRAEAGELSLEVR